MNFNDLRVLLTAMFALIVLTMRTDAETGISKKPTDLLQSSHSNEQTYDPLNPRSFLNDDSITTRLPESKDSNDFLYDDDSANNLQNDDTSEFDVEQLSRKESEKNRIQHSKNKWTERQRDEIKGSNELQQCGVGYDKVCCDGDKIKTDCFCRCEVTTIGTAGDLNCPAGSGAFGTRPTLYKGGDIGDDAAGAGGSESSSVARITSHQMSAFLAGLIATMVVILAI